MRQQKHAQKHACDACSRRKIKCDGNKPCSACTHSSLQCTYLTRPQPKGRQGRSANVISALRASQIGNIHGSIAQRDKNAGPPRSPEYQRTPGLLSSDTIDACSNFFFADFYSTLPVLQREMLDYSGDIMSTTTETYYLIVSFCAFIIIQTGAVHHAASKSDGSLLDRKSVV